MTAPVEVRNPQRVLQRALDKLPPPIWEQPSMAGLKDRIRAALARVPLDLDECEELTRLVAISR